MINTGSTKKYLVYAIGEIALVVIGILIALQINNWNESRKEFEQSLLALSEDIRNDTASIHSYIRSLEQQVKSSALLIPILESESQYIRDSLEFAKAFINLRRPEYRNLG
mgnify:CR=1 FL=1